jgi:hypothetical protein
MALLLPGASMVAGQKSQLIGNIKNSKVVDGCGCYFQFPAESKKKGSKLFVFWSESDEEALMNIDGRDEKLKLVNATEPKGGFKVGARTSMKYTNSDRSVTIIMDRVITRVCPKDDEDCEFIGYDATITITKGDLKQEVKVTGGCGC